MPPPHTFFLSAVTGLLQQAIRFSSHLDSLSENINKFLYIWMSGSNKLAKDSIPPVHNIVRFR